ncbi:MAG: DUF1127 domain-containing protein [Dongiaceae bacterium]
MDSTTNTLHHAAVQPEGFARRLCRAMAATLEQVQVWLDRSAQRRALEGLGDHLLKDLGLSRADVMREATKRFWQE